MSRKELAKKELSRERDVMRTCQDAAPRKGFSDVRIGKGKAWAREKDVHSQEKARALEIDRRRQTCLEERCQALRCQELSKGWFLLRETLRSGENKRR